MKKINFSLYCTRWFGLWKKELETYVLCEKLEYLTLQDT
jgi:hypothetical protein